MLKTCKACSQRLPLDDFYRHPKASNGRMGKCKECTRRAVRKNRAAKLDYYRHYDRERGRLPHRKENAKRTKKRLAEQPGYEIARGWRIRAVFPQKYKARNALSNALRDDRISRKVCERCGDPQSQAHHEDYGRPLEVRWLCSRCHGAEHAAQNERWRRAFVGTILEHSTSHGRPSLVESEEAFYSAASRADQGPFDPRHEFYELGGAS